MNPRIIKEIRLLVWPWCLVLAAALAPIFHSVFHHFHELSNFVWLFGLFGGIPFLAAYSLGSEFQQRTLPLLLAQPVERAKVWTEKQLVLLPALLLAGVIFSLTRPAENELNFEAIAILCAWLLATLCSATFWTLFTRSTIGGVMLGQAAQFILGAVLVNAGLRIFGEELSAKALHVAEAIGAVICLGYSGLMLWLGRRMLIRFQTTGGATGGDLLMSGPRMMPASLASLLRCRATSPTLNLFRKELRLLRPLWLMMLLFVVCWVCVVVTVHFLPRAEEWDSWREVLPTLALAFYMPLAAILAGCLSLGEERLSGTHQWHLTLPVPVRRQWFIKLATALGAGTFSAFVVPFLAISAGQGLLGSPFGADFGWHFGKVDFPDDVVRMVMAVLASFPAFWCASVVNGPVRAALWTVPVIAILCAVGGLGGWAANETIVGATELLSRVIAHYELNPDQFAMGTHFQVFALTLPMLMVAALALFQSSRLFRTQPSDSALSVIRRLVPLAVTAFILMWLGWTWIYASIQQRSTLLVREAQTAVAAAIKSAPELDTEHPLQLTVEDLAKAGPVSGTMRHWLSHAQITVTKHAMKRGTFTSANIRFADGSDFYLNLPVPRE